jgi:hypothetical protein
MNKRTAIFLLMFLAAAALTSCASYVGYGYYGHPYDYDDYHFSYHHDYGHPYYHGHHHDRD